MPPAKLPARDGKLQCLKDRLAKAMELDAVTGKPMPDSPSFSENQFLEPSCSRGDACPESGYWKIRCAANGLIVRIISNL
ncbi:hypothetical protein [Buttiauxella sp. 3AFRM03]|uniref:hypothetical protein n=1 Tax=Buttiauxella sp. 3AFRM03 TaxID=2479367 RepID=UPI0035122368